jgi:Sigma-70, region 4
MSAFALRIPKPRLPVFNPQDWPEDELLEIDPRPESVCFRGQTLAIMRHFFELSCQAGRLPSLLCREFFRAKVTHHAIPSFEEQAVFVRDVELCLERLSDEHAEMIQLIGLYDFSREEIAAMLRRSRSWVSGRIAEAVDSLAEIFLQAGLLKESRPDRRQCQVTNRSIPADVVAAGKKPCASAQVSAEAQDLDCDGNPVDPPWPETGTC